MNGDDKAKAKLTEIYKNAWDEGIWIAEFAAENGCLAAAGCRKVLETTEKRLGQEINIAGLTLGDCWELSACPGTGETRQEACENAIDAFKKEHRPH